jgi:hypothetical protein
MKIENLACNETFSMLGKCKPTTVENAMQCGCCYGENEKCEGRNFHLLATSTVM